MTLKANSKRWRQLRSGQKGWRREQRAACSGGIAAEIPASLLAVRGRNRAILKVRPEFLGHSLRIGRKSKSGAKDQEFSSGFAVCGALW